MKALRLFLIISLLLMVGCTGKTGPAGPSGLSGTPAVNTFQATFQNGGYPTTDYSTELDTWLNGASGTPTTASPYLEINTGSSYSNYGRILVKFDVSEIPVNAQVVSAEILLKLNSSTNVGLSPVTIGLHNFTSDTNPGCHWTINATWLSTGLTGWNACTGDSTQQQEGYINPIIVSTVVFSSSVNGTSGIYKWSIDPSIVQSWLTSSTNNN